MTGKVSLYSTSSSEEASKVSTRAVSVELALTKWIFRRGLKLQKQAAREKKSFRFREQLNERDGFRNTLALGRNDSFGFWIRESTVTVAMARRQWKGVDFLYSCRNSKREFPFSFFCLAREKVLVIWSDDGKWWSVDFIFR